jgi:hypothetical protein
MNIVKKECQQILNRLQGGRFFLAAGDRQQQHYGWSPGISPDCFLAIREEDGGVISASDLMLEVSSGPGYQKIRNHRDRHFSY